MSAIKRRTLKHVKRSNRSALLKAIRDVGPCTKAELSKITGLSATAVSDLTQELKKERRIQIVGKGPSSGGRRPVLFTINPQGGYVLAMELNDDNVGYGIMGLDGRLVKVERVSTKGIHGEELLDVVLDVVDRGIRLVPCKKDLMGLGISTPGLVEPKCGTVILAANLEWQNVELGKVLSEQTNLPVMVENDSNAAALAEHWYGAGQGVQNMVYITLGIGIGAGIIIGGSLYRGMANSAGEIGHTTVVSGGRTCRCGKRGCLEAYCSVKALEAELGDCQGASLGECRRNAPDLYKEVIGKAAGYLGLALGNLVNLLNPEVIVLGSEWLEEDTYFLNRLQQELEVQTLPHPYKSLELRWSRIQHNSGIIGGGTLVLDQLF